MTACGCTTHCLISMEHHCHSMEERKHRHMKRGIYKRGDQEGQTEKTGQDGVSCAPPAPSRWARPHGDGVPGGGPGLVPPQAQRLAGVGRSGVVSGRPWAASHPLAPQRGPHGPSPRCRAPTGRFLPWEKLHIQLHCQSFNLNMTPQGRGGDGQTEERGVQERFGTMFKQFT